MKLTRLFVFAGLALLAQQSSAVGSFEELPTVAPLRVQGSQNLNIDKLYILPGAIVSTDANGVNTYAPPSTFVQLAANESTVTLAGEDIGTFFDYVFRDTSDGKLVFGSRLALSDDGEINDVFRSGFTGYSAAAAWTFSTDNDLRAYSSARTKTGLNGGADVFNADTVDFRSDINLEEGNPFTGLYLVKTDAPNFAFSSLVDPLHNIAPIILRQGGEEGQTVLSVYLAGYVPAAATVPEPETYGMMVAGLALMAWTASRRRRKQPA